MRPYTPKELRTLRLLHEYGFTDAELSDHLALPPLTIRHMRNKLDLAPNGIANGLRMDHRATSRHGGARPGQHGWAAEFKFVDDRATALS